MKIKDLIPWARKDDAAHPASDPDRENPIATLQREMNQVFEGFWNRFGKGFGEVDWPWGQSEAKSDVVQTDNAVEISIELPGMTMDDIEVSVTDDMLTVKGEKKVERQEEKQGYFLSERAYGQIYRAIPLPPSLDTDAAKADLKNGVLTISIPQSAEARSLMKKISVNKA